MKKIIIIGAGPTGLVTAHSLSKKTDYEIQVFDANHFVGGLAGSETIDGMVFDYGPHIFHSAHDDITAFWRENFGDLLTEKDFYSKNYKDGILYDYPISWASIEKFPDQIKERVIEEISCLKPENLKRARNFKECVQELVGPTLQSIFFEKYTEKLWGIPPEKMSANWAPKRIELRKKHKAFWAGQFSAAGKYGAGKVMERLAQIAENNGVRFHLNHKVIGLKTKNYHITDINFQNGNSINIADSIIVSTMPLNTLCQTLNIPCTLMFNSVRLVYIIFSKNLILPKGIDSIYFAHDEFHFHRVTEQKMYSDHGYPDDKTILIFEVSYTARKHLGIISDEQIVKEILKQFCSIGMVKEMDFIKGFSRLLPNVNPVMTLGYEKELSRINAQISKYENLHLAGGAAEFMYGDVQTMVARGWAMADLLSSKHYEINKNIKRGNKFRFNEEVSFYDFNVGQHHPTVVIAEIGINHRGQLELAKQLIQEAKTSGCDLAKLQTYSVSSRVSDVAREAKYADRTLGMEESQSQMLKRFKLSRDHTADLFEFAEEIEMPLFSTPFDEESADELIGLGVKAFKIASFDIVNIPFLRYVASKGLPIILSTGMSSLSEIEDAVEAIAMEKNPNLILLHCVSAYPADISDTNLSVIKTLRNSFRIPIGFSDHTIGILASTVSFSLGADLLEKHFTLDKQLEGPDHILSSDPEEMKELINVRNNVFLALGDGIKKPAPIEFQQINRQRKSLFAGQRIEKGEMLNLDNVAIKGPGLGLQPKYLPLVLGKKVIRPIELDMPITWDDILTD